MDFAELLESKAFTRTRLPLSKPIVVHAVAGAGKTSLLENYARINPAARIYTPIAQQSNSLLLSPFTQSLEQADIVDEYPLSTLHPGVEYVLADPIQYLGSKDLLKPHYICPTTHRFGHSTAEFLTSLGIETYAHKPDRLTIANIFKTEPHGQVIACDLDTQQLAARHSLDYLRPCQSIGKTFKDTTILISHELNRDTLTKEIYIALTRHTNSVTILTPDAPSTSS
ncbi:25 kDa triple gene block protein [Indian citrus ringspot virus]|uniref:Movement and silencing protein TGBp1 n=1 Tax=Indian citrus ringspot virus (isolate Kinnow mandarin/India/K1/1996) TaxID=651357 RepID=TGB1_ICRSV|nr:25 kDa triple gene block protein [Indian citrus ringspot virus]Q918W2.1 RecName: Full=Movement and silencing protein TGBp1; AltName: Full=25 kDa protein; AltName: Full=Silencing suppressor P25; AltName: Full=Triple gene block 1 protein; Short=TGBp1 [Indian citrus ringspot virus K1]AAK97523.1 25 kDa triple gene block protein [Indian citrus ringspot virus]